jgi:hypothetical protein
VTVAGQHHGGGLGQVGAGGAGDLPVTGGAEDRAVLQRGTEGIGVHLGVGAVAQQHKREPGGADQGLGLLVLLAQAQGAGVAVDEPRVGDQAHLGLGRGFDRALHLGVALPVPARGDEQPVDAGEGGHQGLGAVVVGVADLHAPLSQVGGLLWGAHGGHDVVGGHAALEQLLDDQATVVAGGCGDGDHGWSSWRRTGQCLARCSTRYMTPSVIYLWDS